MAFPGFSGFSLCQSENFFTFGEGVMRASFSVIFFLHYEDLHLILSQTEGLRGIMRNKVLRE